MVARSLALLLLGGVLAACGTAGSGAPALPWMAAAPLPLRPFTAPFFVPTADASSFEYVDARTGDDVVVLIATTGSANAASAIGAFQRPSRPSDRPPRPVEVAMSTWEAVDAQRSRLLLAGLGREGMRLYAAPTRDGWACFQLTGVAGDCRPDADSLLWDTWIVRQADRTIVVGLAKDSVSRVGVVVGRHVWRARTGPNAFFLELDGVRFDPRSITALVAIRRDGTGLRLPLDWTSHP